MDVGSVTTRSTYINMTDSSESHHSLRATLITSTATWIENFCELIVDIALRRTAIVIFN